MEFVTSTVTVYAVAFDSSHPSSYIPVLSRAETRARTDARSSYVGGEEGGENDPSVGKRRVQKSKNRQKTELFAGFRIGTVVFRRPSQV